MRNSLMPCAAWYWRFTPNRSASLRTTITAVILTMPFVLPQPTAARDFQERRLCGDYSGGELTGKRASRSPSDIRQGDGKAVLPIHPLLDGAEPGPLEP